MAEPEHKVEIYDDDGPCCRAFCSCGWIGGDHPNNREEAVKEGQMHEGGEYPPWVIPPGEHREWSARGRPFECT
jgi:hypothetical protein